jgi:hypothetical protein
MCALPGCYQRKAHRQGFDLVHFLEGYAKFSDFPETFWDHSGITKKDLGHDPENSQRNLGKTPIFWKFLGFLKPKTAMFLYQKHTDPAMSRGRSGTPEQNW